MSEDVLIRPATEVDAETLVELRERMLVELGHADPAMLERLRRTSLEWFARTFPVGESVGWVAERAGRPVGGLSMSLSQAQPQLRSPSGKVAAIYGLFVVPEERGAGIATQLVREAVMCARQWGAEIVTLHAADKARPLYERIGFSATKEMRLQFSESEIWGP